jgi:hypothetical protein
MYSNLICQQLEQKTCEGETYAVLVLIDIFTAALENLGESIWENYKPSQNFAHVWLLINPPLRPFVEW